MKILVCIKQIFNSEFIENTDDENNCVVTGQNVEYRMNRFDEYALEEALRLKDSFNEIRVDVITAGASRARDVIKRALGMGADRGIHIITDNDIICDPCLTASLFVKETENEHYDLILTGVMSEDLMQGLTGPLFAEMLKIPSASSVVKIELVPGGNLICAEREVESGNREIIEAQLPVLLTVQGGINTPRYPTLSNVLKADSKEIITVHSAGSKKRISVVALRAPEKVRSALFLTGTSSEKAMQLYNILKKKNAMKS